MRPSTSMRRSPPSTSRRPSAADQARLSLIRRASFDPHCPAAPLGCRTGPSVHCFPNGGGPECVGASVAMLGAGSAGTTELRIPRLAVYETRPGQHETASFTDLIKTGGDPAALDPA